jgi:hypothetical protein
MSAAAGAAGEKYVDENTAHKQPHQHRVGEPIEAPPSTSESAPPSTRRKRDCASWECPGCTYLNSGRQCRMCNTPRGMTLGLILQV